MFFVMNMNRYWELFCCRVGNGVLRSMGFVLLVEEMRVRFEKYSVAF